MTDMTNYDGLVVKDEAANGHTLVIFQANDDKFHLFSFLEFTGGGGASYNRESINKWIDEKEFIPLFNIKELAIEVFDDL